MKYHLTVYDDEGEIVKNQEFDHEGIHQYFARGMPSATLNDWGKKSHDLAVRNGFTSTDPVEKIALIHAELSELLEEIRVDRRMSEKCPVISAEGEEVADAFLRLAQYAKMRGIDFDYAVLVKHAYNEGRPFRHGKKF